MFTIDTCFKKKTLKLFMSLLHFSHYTIISLVVIHVIHLKRLNAFEIKDHSKRNIPELFAEHMHVSNKVITMIMGQKKFHYAIC